MPNDSDVDEYRNKNGSSTLPDVSISGVSEPTDTEVLKQSMVQDNDGVNLYFVENKNNNITSEQDNARGRLLINRQLKSMRIELFSSANFSTFQHESAHMMLEMVAGMVQTSECLIT